MKRSVLFTVFLIIAALLLQPLQVSAQSKMANLVGYEKADYVKGMLSINAAGNSVLLVGLQTVYDKPLEIYISKSFDVSKSFKVGEVPPGKKGDIFFNLPALDVGAFDTVLVMVPGWDVPVGVGLLQ